MMESGKYNCRKTVINPKGDEKSFSSLEDFDQFLLEVARSATFSRWAHDHKLLGYFRHNGKEVPNSLVVKLFLKERGYRIT